MTQQEFEINNSTLWRGIEALLENPKAEALDQSIVENLPVAYRRVCHHLAIAKQRRYTPYLVDRLNRCVVGCHNRLYAQSARFRYQWLKFFISGFPEALYRNRVYMRWATFLFLLPSIVLGLLCYFDPEMIYAVISSEQVRDIESMYDPARRVLGRERTADTDLYMFGFYILNNIGIGFREFAGGIVFGIYTIFVLVFNGVFLGAITGHLTQLGYTSTFYPFVIGHGAFELTAIVLCGGAGLKLGASLIDPGNLSRLTALREASRDAVQIVLGSAAMLLIAAFLEAFWSSKAATPIPIKISVGIFLWVCVLSYITFMGRPRKRKGIRKRVFADGRL